jgi:LacI family transcriptional regulator
MTVRELAAILGIGKSTVANALRGKGDVNPETAKHVLQRARELGYEPNPLTSALLRQVRSGASPRVSANVAFLLDFEDPLRLAYIDRLCRGFESRAGLSGLVADKINTGQYTSAKLTRMLLARGIDGIAIFPLERAIGHRTLDWSKFVAVSFGYSMIRPQLSRVVHNHAQGIRTAFRMCRKKGFRRIGLAMNSSSNARSNGLWAAGYLEIQHFLREEERVRPLILPDAEFTARRISGWMDEVKPDVVILHKRDPGLRIPEVVLEHPSRATPVFLDHVHGFAGIDQEYEGLGATMADLLARQLIQNERGIPKHPSITLLDGSWVDFPNSPTPPRS